MKSVGMHPRMKSDREKKLGLLAHAISYAVSNVVQIFLWWILTPDQFFWPLYSLTAWGIGLAFHIWAVYSPSRRIRHQPVRD